jgi:mRNA interferase MazF
MTAFERWTVAVAPFPFVDTAKAKPRPCLVLSGRDWNIRHDHTLCAMITRPLQTEWPSDLPIKDLVTAGLPAPSVIRWKLFTLPNDLLRRAAGVLGLVDRDVATSALAAILPITGT